MNIIDTFLDILFPSACITCNKKGTYFCMECLSIAPPAERESLNWIFPLFDYRHPPIRKAIWMLKYKNKKKLAPIFTEIMYPRILEELSDLSIWHNFKNPILIPIPLSAKRKRKRGFNQATLICKSLEKLDKQNNFILNENILIKIKETEHQAQIKNRQERLKNLINTFKIKNQELIKNKNIILIDDVTTTGATLNEAKKTLKQNGARKVIAFTIAH